MRFLIWPMWTFSVRELNTACFIRQILWNSFFWVAKSYTAFCCSYFLSMPIFLTKDISQGSVATQLRCGVIFKYDFISNLLLSLTVKEFWKSANIWRSYEQDYDVLFFLTHSVYWCSGICDGLFQVRYRLSSLNDDGNYTNYIPSLRVPVIQQHQYAVCQYVGVIPTITWLNTATIGETGLAAC